MYKVNIRFYEELNDFLPANKKKIRFEHYCPHRTSVKDLIESLGVPHSEVDLILVNGISVSFNHVINNNDDISVYPVFESFDISGAQHLCETPLRNKKFIIDGHLGKLAKYLRIAGIDSYYRENILETELIKISQEETRTILTRNRGLLKRSEVNHAYYVRSTTPLTQITEVVERFNLSGSFKPFSRCIECNNELLPVSRLLIENKVPLKVFEYHSEFYQCINCSKVFWKGSHYEKMKILVEKFIPK
jgi:hypothetical protein